MSWLINDLANKAEALLDRVDQTAASALNDEVNSHMSAPSNGMQEEHKAFIPPPPPPAASFPQRTFPSTSQQQHCRSLPLEQHETLHSRGSYAAPAVAPVPRASIPRAAASVSSLKKKEDQDQKLFEFLNSGAAASAGPSTRQTADVPIVDQEQYTQQYQHHSGVCDSLRQTPSTSCVKLLDVSDGGSTPTPKQEAAVSAVNGTRTELDEKASQRISQLELENKLLKTEVASLNEEAANATQQYRRTQEALHSLEQTHHAEGQKFREYRQTAAALQAKEQDYQDALAAKDAQLAVLLVRLREADAALSTKTDLMQKMQGDTERILKDHSASSGLQGVAFDDVRGKLSATEQMLKTEKENSSRWQRELVDAQNKQHEDQQSAALALRTLQSKLNEEKAKSRDTLRQMHSSLDVANNTQRELQDYKEKAARILQAKERLIASLKGGEPTDNQSMLGRGHGGSVELAEMSEERDSLREELQQMRFRTEQLKTELRDTEHRHQMEADEQMEHVQHLESSLDEQRTLGQKISGQLQAATQDGHYLQEELHRFKMAHQREMAARDSEVVALRHELTISCSASSSQQELESRIHSLTDSLIQKQTMVEALGTEKNSLVLQLERLEQQYRIIQENLSQQLNISRNDTSVNEQDDADSPRSRSIASIMPLGVRNSNHVKVTLNTIDKFSIRVGRLLRQYPAARLFVIMYMLLLHLWVTIVLLTYQPEVHSAATNKLPRYLKGDAG